MPRRQELDDDVLNESSKRRSPEKAMEEIRKQKTHNLYCPTCNCNITKTAQLLKKGDEFSHENQKSFVHWIPYFPFKFLSSSPTGPVESNSSNHNHSVLVENNSSNPNPSGPVENNSSNPNSSCGPVDNISSNSSSDGPVKNNSSDPYLSGLVDDNDSSPPSLSHLDRFLEQLPTRFRDSIIRREQDNATPLHQDGAGHQSSTSTSAGKYAESEQHTRVHTHGWHIHRPV